MYLQGFKIAEILNMTKHCLFHAMQLSISRNQRTIRKSIFNTSKRFVSNKHVLQSLIGMYIVYIYTMSLKRTSEGV